MAEKKEEKKPDIYSPEYIVKEHLRRAVKTEHILGNREQMFSAIYENAHQKILAEAVKKYKLKDTSEVHLDQHIKKDDELSKKYQSFVFDGHMDYIRQAANVKLDKNEDPEHFMQGLSRHYMGGTPTELREFIKNVFMNAKSHVDLRGASAAKLVMDAERSPLGKTLEDSLNTYKNAPVLDAVVARDAASVSKDLAKYLKLDKHLVVEHLDNYNIPIAFADRIVRQKKDVTREEIEDMLTRTGKKHLLKPLR